MLARLNLSRFYNFFRGQTVTLTANPETKDLPIDNSTSIIQKTLCDSQIVKVCDDDLCKMVAKLDTILIRFEEERHDWEDHKRKLPAATPIQHLIATQQISLKTIFSDVLETLQTFVRTTDKNLDGLIDQIKPKVTNLCNDLHATCSEVLKDDLSEPQKIQLEHHICDNCLTMLNDLIGFIKDVKAQINVSLKIEEIGEQIALHIARFVVLLLTDLPLPNIDFKISGLYRKFLYREIEPEARTINTLLVTTESEMLYAEEVLKKCNAPKLDTRPELPTPRP